MSTQIPVSFVSQFRDNLVVKYQQQGSKLRGAVTVESPIGEDSYTELLAATTAVKKTSRHSDTPLVDSPHSRRKYDISDYEWADLIDKEDRRKMLINPDNKYAVNAANALGRATDEDIITAFDADVLEGHTGSSTVQFPGGQSIAHGSAGLTKAKIIEAAKILNQNNVPMSERFFAYSPKALEYVLNDSTLTSADYNTVRLLMSGEIEYFMGFRWIISTLLPIDGSSVRSCFAWHRQAMNLGVQTDISVRMSERGDKSYATQVYANMSIGALRVQDEGVVRVYVDETAAIS